MIISTILNVVASRIVKLAGKSENNPKTANWLAVASSLGAALGLSPAASQGAGDALIALGTLLKAL